MPTANISHVTLSNTFSDWRAATNDLANSANELRNSNYTKENGAVLNIKNGALYINKQTGTTLNVYANVNVENNFTTKTKIVLGDATYNGDDARFANSKVIVDIANTLAVKNLTSNAYITSANTITTDLIVGSDDTGECWIQGDPYPARKPLYVEGVFQDLDRGINFYGNSIASVVVTANVANNKVIDLAIDVPLLDGSQGVKGQKGQKGQPGISGIQGFQGLTGSKGVPGVQGAQGSAGSKGLVGDTTGGTKGVKGDKGEFGYGQLGDDGEKGQKGESIGAAKGQKGSKGDKGTLGDDGVSPAKGEKGDTGDLGNLGDAGIEGDSRELIAAYANLGGGWLVGYVSPTINASNNISSIAISDVYWMAGATPMKLYTISFINPLPDSNYAVVGSSRKPTPTEDINFYRVGSGHLQTYSKTTTEFQIAFALCGDGMYTTRYYVPSDASVIVVRNPV